MPEFMLECSRCLAGHEPDLYTLTCAECRSPLDVAYPDADFAVAVPPMPVSEAGLISITLGEGNTPVVTLPAVDRAIGLSKLRAKLEYMSPTGSFKDRGTVVMLAVAKAAGVKEVVEDSSGNAGASVSAYAARVGIIAHIFVPASAPEAKLRQIRAYGARVHPVEGPRDMATEAAMDFATERKLPYTSHVLSPYFNEGTKNFAYEVFRTHSRALPRHIVFPVGNGSLILGAWKGFAELSAGGHIAEIPRLHCVQAEAVQPIVAAFTGEAASSAGSTIAGGIAVAGPARRDQVLDAVRKSGGAAVAVSESAIVDWRETLARREGVYAEPTSAAAFAGLEILVSRGVIRPDDSVLVPITGFGLKDA